MPDLVIQRPDPAALSSESLTLQEKAASLIVKDKFTHAFALEAIRDLRSLEKRITDHFEPTRAALDKAKKELLAARDALVKPVETARLEVGRKCDTYEAEERPREAEERARLEAEGFAARLSKFCLRIFVTIDSSTASIHYSIHYVNRKSKVKKKQN